MPVQLRAWLVTFSTHKADMSVGIGISKAHQVRQANGRLKQTCKQTVTKLPTFFMHKFTQTGLWDLPGRWNCKQNLNLLPWNPPSQQLHQMPTTQETCAKIGKYYNELCLYNLSDVKFMELSNFNPQCYQFSHSRQQRWFLPMTRAGLIANYIPLLFFHPL